MHWNNILCIIKLSIQSAPMYWCLNQPNNSTSYVISTKHCTNFAIVHVYTHCMFERLDVMKCCFFCGEKLSFVVWCIDFLFKLYQQVVKITSGSLDTVANGFQIFLLKFNFVVEVPWKLCLLCCIWLHVQRKRIASIFSLSLFLIKYLPCQHQRSRSFLSAFGS